MVTFQLARPMTPTVRCITIQLREFSWYYLYWYRYVPCDREIQNSTALLELYRVYLTSERDRRLIPGIESSRFDSSQYVLISVKPGGTFLSWLVVLPNPPTRWNIDSSSLLLLLLPLSIGDCLVDLLSAPRRSRWYRLRTLHTRQNDYILYENVPTSR